jgi:lipoprotein-anchoring transpeptidase ErfK/SrfK
VAGLHRNLWHAERELSPAVAQAIPPLDDLQQRPDAVFDLYDGNFAIHGTTHVSQLGGPASRGCIRLHPSNAAILFSLVQREGLGNTRISIH